MIDIKKIRERHGWTQEDLARECEVSVRTVQNWEGGRPIPASKIKLINKLDADEIISSYGDKNKESDNDLKYTYLIPMSAAGGSLVGFDEGGAAIMDCERIVSPIDDVDFAIPVAGDSMSPDYPAGARVLVKRIDPDMYIAWGNVYVIDTPNGIIIKEVQPSGIDGRIVCHSHNPSGRFKDFEISLQDVRAMYRVLACITMK